MGTKHLFLALIFLFIGTLVNAQSDDVSLTINAGPTTTFLDSGVGYHIGLNPAYPINNWLALEGQLSHTQTFIERAFLTGERERLNGSSILAGPRIYFVSEKSSGVAAYINFLFGGIRTLEVEFDTEELEYGPGFSGGIYLQLKKLQFGVAVETPQNMILKVGYRIL